jgi:hypothetical protein
MVLEIGHLENRSEIAVWNVVLEMDGVLLDRSCEKRKSVAQSQERKEYPTYNNTKKVISCL